MADESNLNGRQIGNYRIVAEINSGSYGSVYTGKHLIFEDDPIVAIKVLHAHLGSPLEREQFIREAQLLKKLKHPFILPILDAGIHNGFPYIITEYASRGSLRDRLNQQPNQPLPLEEALTTLSQIGQALYHAHKNNIAHRDLKPANILFNDKGEALLADFGIAAALTTTGTKVLGKGGTPAYMAPEQFEGIVSMKSDQYVLGCIAYELLTGPKPFNVENVPVIAVQYQHARFDPIAPTALNPQVSTYVEQAILTAMAKDRANRYADVHVFLTELQRSNESSKKSSSSDASSKKSQFDYSAMHETIKFVLGESGKYYFQYLSPISGEWVFLGNKHMNYFSPDPILCERYIREWYRRTLKGEVLSIATCPPPTIADTATEEEVTAK